MKPFISIVVPVYKVEDCLDKCVQSLINQTFTDIEVILVNDGSPDQCPDMCDQYAEQDERIRVVHKTNGGLSDARNRGLEISNGEYVLFLDSDDYINLDCCSEFYKVLEGGKKRVDIIAGNGVLIEGEQRLPIERDFEPGFSFMDGREFLKRQIKAGTMHVMAWLNLYNRRFLEDNSLWFKVGLLHEDIQFTPRAFLKARQVLNTEITFYNYIVREGSITQQKDMSRNGIHIIETCHELSGIFSDIDCPELRMLLNDWLVTKYLYGFQLGGLHRREFKSLINLGFLRNKACSKRNRMKVLLISVNPMLYYLINKAVGFCPKLRRN